MRSLCRAKNSECVHVKQSQLLTCCIRARTGEEMGVGAGIGSWTAGGGTAVVSYATQKVVQNERVKKSL